MKGEYDMKSVREKNGENWKTPREKKPKPRIYSSQT